LKFFLHAILPRLVREQDHAIHETLELAERESPFDWTLCSHGRRGDSVSRRRALGADARSLLGGNRNSGRNAIQSRRYPNALVALLVVAIWPEQHPIPAKRADE
jgi:hypothetical protein